VCSRTPTRFLTPLMVNPNGFASSLIVAGPPPRRSKISRRVGSESAKNVPLVSTIVHRSVHLSTQAVPAVEALGSEALQERVEPSDGKGDPARARPGRVRLDEQPGALVDLPENLFPTRRSGGRAKNRVYQSMLASRSDTGTPAKRWVIALVSGR
jgi:hypothetical protein